MITAALLCLAMNLYQESSVDGLDGMVAVAYITDKRAEHNQKNYCREVYKSGAFSWTKKGKEAKVDKKSKAWVDAQAVARTFKSFSDRTGGATHYHKKGIKPYWVKVMKKVATTKSHILYVALNK